MEIRLSQPQRERAKGLLRMEYTLRELATELQASPDQLKRACEFAACPHRVDNRGRLWIVGTEFHQWYETHAAQRKHPLADNEAYCLRCRQAVPLTVTEVNPRPHGLELRKGICPQCGANINRIGRAKS